MATSVNKIVTALGVVGVLTVGGFVKAGSAVITQRSLWRGEYSQTGAVPTDIMRARSSYYGRRIQTRNWREFLFTQRCFHGVSTV